MVSIINNVITVSPPAYPSITVQNGVRGLSAYEVAVENGFVGTEEEWLASLVGGGGSSTTQWGAVEW